MFISLRLRKQLFVFFAGFWGPLRGRPAWSGRSGSVFAAIALWVSVSGVHPPAGGWRPASTASPQPSDLRAPNAPKAADPRRKSAATSAAKPLESGTELWFLEKSDVGSLARLSPRRWRFSPQVAGGLVPFPPGSGRARQPIVAFAKPAQTLGLISCLYRAFRSPARGESLFVPAQKNICLEGIRWRSVSC